jgi:CheY-like chemotaxis protein
MALDSETQSELALEHFGGDFAPPARILVADDDEMFGRFLSEFFRREGCQCERVLEAAPAERLLGAKKFDLLIADIYMPGNVGLELIEHLPQIAAGLPVILLTGRPSIETAARSVGLSVSAYLTKPPDLGELRMQARQAILTYRNLRMISLGQQRLQQWQMQLREIEDLLQRAPGKRHSAPWNRYLSVTLENLLLTLLELKQFSDNAAVAEALGPRLRSAELLAALRRTVTVLRNSRQHFRSKDLGDLRHELESLLRFDGIGEIPSTPEENSDGSRSDQPTPS